MARKLSTKTLDKHVQGVLRLWGEDPKDRASIATAMIINHVEREFPDVRTNHS